WTEAATTAGQIEIEDYARQRMTDPGERLMAMMDAAVLGFGFGAIERGGTAGISALAPERAADVAIADGLRVMQSADGAARLGAMLDAAAEAKLGERSEADLRAFLKASGADGNVYLSAEQATTLFQSEMLADMVGESLEVQLAAGDVAIPVDQFLARAAKLPNVDEIKRHVRARAEDVSLAEVEGIDFDAMAKQLGVAEEATTVAPDTVNARQQVTDDVMAQLVATGKYTPAAAETQAKLWGAAMDRLGAMSGTDAFSLYQRYMGGIAAGTNAAEPSMTMDQPAYHGTPHNVDRFSLQKIGTGEGAQVYGWGLYFANKRE